ncbi:MAG: hypothetical protein HY896_03005 [Deltaproteobacteria bacterium]|nr:hypothetical protein [Deltaproteobacteria bacterium]
MAIEELKSIFRPIAFRREKDENSSRRGKKRPAPPKEKDAEPEPGKRNVDIKV